MFCAPPVEAAVAGGNARWGEGTIAPCARSPAPVRRHRRGRNRRKVSLNRAEPQCSRLPPARVTIF
jgi:hypothetical protein